MQDPLSIREAGPDDADALAALLELSDLDPAGILTPGSRYWVVVEPGERIVGVIGLEYGPQAALLRSAAVHPDLRRHGLGARLLNHAYTMAAADGVAALYCFSTGAGPFWKSQGFCEVPVPELVEALPDSFQVHHYQELGWLPTEVAWRRDLNPSTNDE